MPATGSMSMIAFHMVTFRSSVSAKYSMPVPNTSFPAMNRQIDSYRGRLALPAANGMDEIVLLLPNISERENTGSIVIKSQNFHYDY